MAQNIAGHVTKFGLFAPPTSLESLLLQLKKSVSYYPLGNEHLIQQIIDKFPSQVVMDTLSENPHLNSEGAENLLGILKQVNQKEPTENSPAQTEEEYDDAPLATSHM